LKKGEDFVRCQKEKQRTDAEEKMFTGRVRKREEGTVLTRWQAVDKKIFY